MYHSHLSAKTIILYTVLETGLKQSCFTHSTIIHKADVDVNTGTKIDPILTPGLNNYTIILYPPEVNHQSYLNLTCSMLLAGKRAISLI
jgi:hypothetical protein